LGHVVNSSYVAHLGGPATCLDGGRRRFGNWRWRHLDALEANGVSQSRFSVMVILPWVLLTIMVAMLAFTLGKRQTDKTQ
jgi:hypothetical protein